MAPWYACSVVRFAAWKPHKRPIVVVSTTFVDVVVLALFLWVGFCFGCYITRMPSLDAARGLCCNKLGIRPHCYSLPQFVCEFGFFSFSFFPFAFPYAFPWPPCCQFFMLCFSPIASPGTLLDLGLEGVIVSLGLSLVTEDVSSGTCYIASQYE